MEVEVAIRLLYMLGEALPASHGAHFTGDTAKTSALQDMMRTVSHTTLTYVLFNICWTWLYFDEHTIWKSMWKRYITRMCFLV